jgi:hypothetical protein
LDQATAVILPSVIMWAFMIAFAFYRLRRYRAGTLEREALAHMRIAHARRTGDLRVLEAASKTSTTAAGAPDEQSPPVRLRRRRRWRLSRLIRL